MIKLANTDLTIYPLCLGGNVFGYSADKDNSETVLTFYADNGGNFIDTVRNVGYRFAITNAGADTASDIKI